MQQNQINEQGADEQDNPALSKVIERNIHTHPFAYVDHANSDLADLEMETKPEDVLAEIHRLQQIEYGNRNE